MNTFNVSSIGAVYNTRKTPEDDYWGQVVSEIRLNNDWDVTSLDGIDAFSHVEIKREGLSIFVKGLDAIDGTPVLDIKPVMNEFLPKGEVKQPNWSADLMSNYWE